MPAQPYLVALNARLAEALGGLPPETRERHLNYLFRAQNSDGGFPGREGGSDLYYTAFGLRTLSVLGGLSPALCEKAAGFLGSSLRSEASVVDFFSLLYSILLVQVNGGPDVLGGSPPDWPERVAQTLEGLRTQDGGYAKAPGNASGSTYHSFLVALCYQLLGREVPEPQRLIQFVLSRHRDDGGFVEIAPMRRGGTNPTAAAVGVLQILEGLGEGREGFTPEIREGVIAFLADMPSFEGGMRANGRAPLADLLSTFTGCWTLSELGALGRVDGEGMLNYAHSAERAEGGFRGGLWDEGHDVEYTFYGLGVLGLLS
jgi:geranylgeranyl transferase type-2 subunit beta